MGERVLVTEPEFRKAEEEFSAANGLSVECAPPGEDALAERVHATGCRAVVIGVERYAGPLYEAMGEAAGDGGALLARFGVGHDGVDKELARRHGITVTNTPGVLDQSVAEHALALMLALARRVARLDASVRGGSWEMMTGAELGGRRLAVIGFGAIGRRVAAAAGRAFGMGVVAVGRRSGEELARDEGRALEDIREEFGVATYTTDADAALEDADVVSLHLPGTPQTRHFLDARRLAAMKPAALLVNTSRGSVVDEAALYDALLGGRPAGAALDVFENEPYEPVEPGRDLRMLDNVLLTPHVGSNTREANARMARACLRNVRCFFDGRPDELTRVEPSGE